MGRTLVYSISLLLVASAAPAEQAPEEDDKLLQGMSIVGDHESPRSLVIVPWKSSDLGDTLDVSRILDDGRGPVDRDVFLRELDYYQIVVESMESHASETP